MINNVAKFTPGLTRTALEEACDSVGLDSTDAVLIRLGENAMYRLRGKSVMARIGRSKAVAHKETLVAEWLAAYEFQTACLFSHSNQPLITKDGFSVTFWEFIREVAEPVTSADLGRILRELHALPPPTSFRLPDFSPMPKMAERIRRLGIPPASALLGVPVGRPHGVVKFNLRDHVHAGHADLRDSYQ